MGLYKYRLVCYTDASGGQATHEAFLTKITCRRILAGLVVAFGPDGDVRAEDNPL